MSGPSAPEEVVVEETGGGKFQVEAKTASGAFLVDEPASVGGLGTGPNPYDLLAAALGACTTMTMRLYANQKGWPLTHVRVSVIHSRPDLQSKDVFERKITMEGALDDTQRARLIQIAERCPVHLTLSRGSDIATVVTPAEPAPAPCDGPQHKGGMDEACAD